ncbi:MAG: ABC transporter permease [Chlorobi bacterium]|nr:ABC transporter permease [Chlorobiota bacterium]
MATYIVKRILLFIPTLLAITIVTFGISRLAPGDPVDQLLGLQAGGDQQADKEATEAMRQQIREELGLDKPWPTQYLNWAAGVFILNFGKSYTDRKPVTDKIMDRIDVTLGMNILSIILAYLIAIPIGIYSATHSGSFGDRLSSTTLFALYSIPTFWAGTLVLVYLTNNDYLIQLFPTRGLHSTGYDSSWPWWKAWIDTGWHLAAPVLIYTYTSFAFISRQMRAGMIEVIRQDYIRTARAKGLSEKVVVYKHALRNSLIPIITLLAGLLPALISGSIIVELIFSVPGMGLLSFHALLARDYPVIMGVLTLGAILTMVGVLIADLLYSVVDPRIAFSKKNA